MKFQFTPNLDYQQEAINSIVDIFDTGRNVLASERPFELHAQSPVVANELDIEGRQIIQNVHSVQEKNGLEKSETETTGVKIPATLPMSGDKKLKSGMDFTVEMETGTGKTYVYLRTALELNRKYGLKKFIVLVPSVAIREGVMKTIQQTKEHFRELYGRGFNAFEYDSGKLSRVRDFTQGVDVQLMVMTIQSFNKDVNVMRQTPDRFHGERPLDLISQTRPIVIMDEPQNMESDLSKSAIADLNALFKLRYSATHKELHNLMYRLTPVDAYRQRLVKRIEVYGVEEGDNEVFMMRVKDIKTQAGASPTAQAIVEVKTASGEYEPKEMTLKAGVDIFRKTKNEKYRDLLVNDVNAKYNRVELSDGKYHYLEANIGENKEAVFRTQIRETIKTHLDKQEAVGDSLKVLSLFFIDKVDNYIHDDSLIRAIFEEEYTKLAANYTHASTKSANEVHKGYFAYNKSKGAVTYKDSSTGKSQADKEAYDLIMKDKEQLLSLQEPVSFIFSHSALNEGWDNPNVFQICTLNETRSGLKKRQEIGRGLRLPVDVNGQRVFDEKTNTLSVIANESYREFVASLQREYHEAGYREAPEAPNARERVQVSFKKHLPAENEYFQELWERIRKKTRFSIELKTDELVNNTVERIAELDVDSLVVRVDRVAVDFDNKDRIKTVYQTPSAGERLQRDIRIGNVIARIERETGLTRKTIYKILTQANNLELIFDNPEEYTRSVIEIIRAELNQLLINDGLQYHPISDVWEVELFEDFDSYKNRTVELDKSAYDRVVYDSDGEREFAESLERSNRVKLFVKLPSRFVVDTPLGSYNPDWAIVVEDNGQERLYLVRETKFNTTFEQLRDEEKKKIVCGDKHFNAIGADFKVSYQRDLSDL